MGARPEETPRPVHQKADGREATPSKRNSDARSSRAPVVPRTGPAVSTAPWPKPGCGPRYRCGTRGRRDPKCQLASDRRGSSPVSMTNSSPSSVLLRKEVIQPHLPVRLPCYDFTPIADPTFDGSLPKGLGHRLRAFPTFVV